MKKLLPYLVILIFVFAACSKSNSKTQTQTSPPGISGKINGKYTTFNGSISVDTSSGEISITASADSTPFTSSILEIVLDATAPFKPGLYPYSYDPNAVYESGLGIATTINYSQVLFGSNDDSVTVTAVTDSSVAGTFHGTVNGRVLDQNSPTFYRDTTAVITEGKFNVKW